MGDFFSYKIHAISGMNIAQALIDSQKAEKTLSSGDLNLIIGKDSYYYKNAMPDELVNNKWPFKISIAYNKNTGDIEYLSKWVEDDRIVSAITELFPNEVFYVQRIAPYFDHSCSWYEKNTNLSTWDGREVKNVIFPVRTKLIRRKDENAIIALPVGNKDERWGKITVPLKDIPPLPEEYGTRADSALINLTEDRIFVRFQNHTENISTDELIRRYQEARVWYREQMKEEVLLTEIPAENFYHYTRRSDDCSFYILTLNCDPSTSQDGKLRITVSEENANPENGNIILGLRGKSKTAIVKNEAGEEVKTDIPIKQIEKEWNLSKALSRQNIWEGIAMTEPEEEMEH